MPQISIPAVFVRGGTSKALIFHRTDLPPASPPSDTAAWDRIFRAALGSPDPNGRQLDGMGGGVSSLSKIAVIGPPSRGDADVDYTFAQVGIADEVVGYRGNCGNISSAVGPFAVDEGLVTAMGGEAVVRIHNTNTGKLIIARFPLVGGKAAVSGDFSLQGVAGTGAPVRLAFVDPGGAATGKLLPSGRARDSLQIAGFGALEVSLVDAANPVVFVAATALGLSATEMPDDLAADAPRMRLFEEIRVAAAVAMGLVAHPEEARTRLKNLPQVALVAPPSAARTLRGDVIAKEAMDVLVRVISTGQPHRATPLTGGMCLAVAARIPGTIPNALARPAADDADIRVAHPSGVLVVAAAIERAGGMVVAREAVVYRTARRLMEGRVCLQG